MSDWPSIYKELEILGERRKKRVASTNTIEAFEAASGITLPKAYREFASLFGAGELCEYYRFYVPLDRKDEYDLGTYNSTIHEDSDEDTWSDYAAPEVFSQLLFFGSTIGGELFAWRIDEVSQPTASEYVIYRLFRSPKMRKVAKSFREFFDKCREGTLDPFDEPLRQSFLKY